MKYNSYLVYKTHWIGCDIYLNEIGWITDIVLIAYSLFAFWIKHCSGY